MECQRVVRCAETTPDIIVAHCLRTQHPLFGGLDDKHQRALPLVLLRCHQACGTNQAGDMHIMTTSVHRVDHVAGNRILLLRTRCIRQAGFFFDRQTVHVRPHHDQRSFTIFHDCDDTGPTDAFSNLEACKTQLQRHAARGLMLDGRKLRIAMKVIKQARKVLIVVLLNYSTQVLRHRRNRKQ